MRIVSLIAILCLLSGIVVARPILPEQPAPSFDETLSFYTPTCRSYALKFMEAAQGAQALFVQGQTRDADLSFRYMRSHIDTLMNSPDCSLDDLILTYQISGELEKLNNQIICKIRITEALQDFARADEIVQTSDKLEDLKRGHDHMMTARWTIKEIETENLCSDMGLDYMGSISELRIMFDLTLEYLSGAIDEFE